jgi:acyl carrier protein
MDENQFIANFKEALEMEEGQTLNWSDEFRNYDEWDSLGQMSLIAMMEDNYGLTIENEDFEKLITVQDLFEEVKKRSSSN